MALIRQFGVSVVTRPECGRTSGSPDCWEYLYTLCKAERRCEIYPDEREKP